MNLYKLQRKRYDLICELQVLIAQQSKPDELSDFTPQRIQGISNKFPLTWMIAEVRKGEIVFDINTNPLHQKLMEIYFTEQQIDAENRNHIKKFINTKFKGLRTRMTDLERSYKGLLQKYTYLMKQNKKIMEK